MKLADILAILRRLAPESLAEPWDRVGLQVGSEDQPVRRAMLCIDLTEPVLAEALRQRADLVVAYHPPIFKPLAALTDADFKQRIIRQAIQAGVAIYSPHTALDAAAGGINDWLCESVLPGVVEAVSSAEKGALAKGGAVRAIRPIAPAEGRRPYKLVTFVPPSHLDTVRSALCQAGAGRIGDYTDCSFSVEGEGTFRGGQTTQPTIGQRGRLERVTERRLETIVPAQRLAEVVAALMKAHPYEEPAFDLIRLALPPSQGGEGVGQGRVVTLDRPISLQALIQRLKAHLGVPRLEVAHADKSRPIKKIGFCAGAGGSLLGEAGPLDAYVTGEMRHHEVLEAAARGTVIVLAGHTQTERPYLPLYRKRIEAQGGGRGVRWAISRRDRPPSSLR
ncbi:MAG TPA: Nif3-like dinuclear metal center hexameric protein [Phycisphaeraceae bacterium]